ncbi:PBPRA1643 family SWIM/SEC-C metal-binding motif protein [Sansalvadorimonas verongulae]|uniref:PBPRA1643 family SWIM/SEC-C metal-binding motif protein n=1 Tax=Sansalvadorimonas verongulae TaxID=2172824 RepID=UPI0012BD3793|nr:PBPRA1643 family SWIM/SEC-C metal-binding motif protein [Sansalvadorimonas verongulae]MTI15379.1 zinc chelation protein SecC [Sansalvadorimonas verongulae]
MGKHYTQTNLQIDDRVSQRDFSGKRQARLGTEKNPASVTVQTEERKAELEKIFQEHEWAFSIAVNEEAVEDVSDLELLKKIPTTTTVLEKTPGRNDPCSCGSGKKYKKCCG